jgi:hypothetical protein
MERIRKQLRELEVEKPDEDENQLYERIYDLGTTRSGCLLDPERRLLCRILQQMDLQALVDTPPLMGTARVQQHVGAVYLLPLRVNLAPLLQQWLKERETFRAVIDRPTLSISEETSRRAAGSIWWMHELFDLR